MAQTPAWVTYAERELADMCDNRRRWTNLHALFVGTDGRQRADRVTPTLHNDRLQSFGERFLGDCNCLVLASAEGAGFGHTISWRLPMNALTGANIRDAELSEIGPLAKIWFDGWQDAHARIVPAQLARQRTLQSFEERLRAASAGVRVAEAGGAPLGFYFLKGAELYQFYVSSNARGSGVAAVLMADAEVRLAESGVQTAWLACAIGNHRAARFYEKSGWIRTGTVIDDVAVPGGTFAIEVWRYEKSVR
jgi:GNAT superfamily N-acetyltransferase